MRCRDARNADRGRRPAPACHERRRSPRRGASPSAADRRVPPTGTPAANSGAGVRPSGCPARRRSARNRAEGPAVHKPISSHASMLGRNEPANQMQTPVGLRCQQPASAPCVLRDAPSRALLSMRDVFDGIHKSPHPEEPASGRLEGRTAPVQPIIGFATVPQCGKGFIRGPAAGSRSSRLRPSPSSWPRRRPR
jgi:hypothetical protein